MATTKELLEKAILKVSAGVDAVSAESIAITTQTTDYQDYIPPCDGYIQFSQVSGKNDSYFAVRPRGKSNNSPIFSGMCVNAGGYAINTFRCFKGIPVAYKSSDASATMKSMAFWKSIGGGLGFLRKLLGVEVNYGYA